MIAVHRRVCCYIFAVYDRSFFGGLSGSLKWFPILIVMVLHV